MRIYSKSLDWGGGPFTDIYNLFLERIRRSQKIDNNFSYNFQILNFKHIDIVSLKNKKKVVDC
jgi:hypothetical protein